MSSHPLLKYETECWEHGHPHVAGVDEAGRGPLAGPVVVAGAIFERDFVIEGVTDSKQLTEERREFFFNTIQSSALAFHIEIIDHEKIDKINILQASLLGMRMCVEKMRIPADFVLIDGNSEAFPKNNTYHTRQRPIVKGDAKSFTIAAASILAKVTRDRLMVEYDKIFPQYGFAKHKGYPTADHIQALKKHGLCMIHRKTFCAGIMNEQMGLEF
ncbi:MAG TPA: ribonuclease HII [bacterium]|nr:ribonuclease HII [bacterium]HMW32270.1 ribonuclease HII [bacterium]HMY34993.1 ribonuclease HII [bacterium]HMZ03621.1 ribonuclease HII [bacterium]HNB58227.1 ribonuclease HII [bacterium]